MTDTTTTNTTAEEDRKLHKRKKKERKKLKKKEAKKEKKKNHSKSKRHEKQERNYDTPPSNNKDVVVEEEATDNSAHEEEKKEDDVYPQSPAVEVSSSPDTSRTSKKDRKEKKRKRKEKNGKRKSSDDDDDDKSQKEENPAKRSKGDDDEKSSPTKDSGPAAKAKATTTEEEMQDVDANNNQSNNDDPRIVESSALDFGPEQASQKNGVTLLLFYQYVEPIWSLEKYQQVLKDMEKLGNSLQLTGRMRVAREGLNCTLTSTNRSQMLRFCKALRQQPEFQTTEFKLTHDLPQAQRFPHLKVIEVIELVHYGLEGEKAPPIQDYHGVHLEPQDYHKKIAEKDTVMIDVRNHYEAIIGHFQPPNKDALLDPMMRKSTEFPVWLDKPETKEKLKGKQVLMYCTGGIRCERATALLKYKMENDPEIKDLGIQEVYQLQGGIDKYFKQFPDGGFWQGKNYVFDKRFAHKPAAVEGKEQRGEAKPEPMSRCEACQKPWDRFRGKRRCPTCGVPSLICKECLEQKGKSNLRDVRCDLCVAEGITSKHQLRNKEQMEIEEYEQKLVDRGLIPQPEAKGERLKVTPSGGGGTRAGANSNVKEAPSTKQHATKKKHNNKNHATGNGKIPDNPNGVTRLYLKNMCRNSMDENTLMEFLPGITHIVWRSDRKSGQFLGQGWVEMATTDDAATAVAKNGQRVLNRPLYINYQPPDPKDLWPPPNSKVALAADNSSF